MTRNGTPGPPPMEPFRIKMIEPIVPTTRTRRARALRDAGFNLFRIPSELVQIDLLTDSGTCAMSDAQWGAILAGDESYAGSRSFVRFERAVRDLTGFPHVIPTHQGRGAEHLLFHVLLNKGDVVPNNCHFDTTRANVEARGSRAVDCVGDCAYDTDCTCDFKGNMDLEKLERVLRRGHVPLVMMTVTNNAGGGQPASLKNLRAVSRIARKHRVPFFLDACRFAENAWFIREREDRRSIRAVVRDLFSVADGCTMSAKKDGLANIGGFLACRDADLADRLKQILILYEGFPTYGGLAGRDLDAIALGLNEAVEERYLEYRIGQVRYLWNRLVRAGIPVMHPPGGHAVFLDARQFLPHVPPGEFPGQALACALYVEGGIRSCEIGGLMFSGNGSPPKLDLVRLALPRRVYTQSHLDYVAEQIQRLYGRRAGIRGVRIVRDAPRLRHFLAELEPLGHFH